MIGLTEYHQNFLQTVLSESESRGLLKPQAFLEICCEELGEIGDLTNNYTAAEYIKTGIEIHGYDFDEERGILSLLVHQFFQEDEIQTLTKTQINTKFNRLKNFLKKCSALQNDLEETSEAYEMVHYINKYLEKDKVQKVRLILISDGKSTRNLSIIESEIIADLPVEFRVIDIEYFYQTYMSKSASGEIEVNTSLPSLEIKGNSETYKSYLSVISGEQLVEIYENYGQKLFEQNVRTFLQFKGNVNKGIKNTIEYQPDMFFAYNNGITATASSVETDNKGNIVKIQNLQIVNGGQTTSAIYASKRNLKKNVSDISVQMKLTVVKKEGDQSNFVSKISEYANTQNKVNKSDFFSNSPFHLEMKDYSKRVWVPATNGSQRRTHWFYERVRGEYLNEQAYLTKAEKTRFQLENPKNQMLDKTFLAKSENSWMQKPQVVAKGAQYSFADFADYVTSQLEKNNKVITESYFKDVVARVILFRNIEKIVSDANWYENAFRAQIVTYTMAYLSYIVEKKDKFFNFQRIWETQKLPRDVYNAIEVISEHVHKSITNPLEGSANITQWSKKDACWSKIKELQIPVKLTSEMLIAKEEAKNIMKQEKKEKKLLTEVEMQIFVVKTEMKIWTQVYEYYRDQNSKKINSMQLDILRKWATGRMDYPSEKQSVILYKLLKQISEEGIFVIEGIKY
ncbi:AIPR family protein [Planococcus beijingensis]|uniref:AIPR family protein n=1 Tax=Planococcus beijingensis TaxID=2782551 RepID=UPI00193BB788|nr:AIPR family protein [Planococcus beijingensis]